MLQRLVDDFRAGAGSAARLTAFAVVIVVSMFVTTGFLAAAAFMFVLPREGAVAACFAGGAVYVVITLVATAAYAIRRRQDRLRHDQAARDAAQSAKSTASTLLSDPAVLAMGLQLVRVVGIRRLIPLLAIGGVALGLLASQRKREPVDTE
jgi:hypothetical protein